LEIDEPLKDISDQISVISDQAKDIWKPIQDDIAKNIDDTVKSISDVTNEAVGNAVKSISDATNEAKNILEPIQYNISKNIEETIKTINEASNEHINNAADSINEHIDSINEHINSATDSIKNAVEYIKTTNSETAILENINEDFEIVEENPEPIEEWPIFPEARIGSEELMNEAVKVDPAFNSKNKDDNSDGSLEADEFTTEIPILVENLPQNDQPSLDQDQNKKQKIDKETIESILKDNVEEKSITAELPQVDQPVKDKVQEENGVFIDAVKRSDTGTENLESPKEGELLKDATLSDSPRKSRVYIEEVDGIPKEKPIVSKDVPKGIPEDPVQNVPEVKEDSTQESAVATSPIPEVIPEKKEPQGDVKMATDSPVESTDIPIDITKNKKVSKNKESIPKIEEESTLINEGNEEEILEENVEDVQSSGDEHIDEEVPVVSEDGTINEAEESLEATEAPPVIPSESENTLDETVDPATGAPVPDQDIADQESTENKTSQPKGMAPPKTNQKDQVHPHKLSSSDEVSSQRYLPPSQEQVRIAEPHPLSAGAIVGIIFGVLMCSGFIVAAASFIVYQRRFHIRPKVLNSDRGYAGSDSGGYIDDDAVRVSYVNSQTDMPKEDNQTFRMRLNTTEGE